MSASPGGDSVTERYDVTIIGAGPGGYVAAIRAAQLGLAVAIVEQEALGGVCLNWGCIPSKALLRNAQVASLLGRGKEFGFSTSGLKLDFGAAVDRSRRVSNRLVKGVAALMKSNGVEVVEGQGSLGSCNTVHVSLNEGGQRTIHTHNTIVGTGARPRGLPGVEVDGERVMTYREAILLRDLPTSVIIVGAGPIGMEFAHLWQAYGAEVTVVEMLPRVLPLEDQEVSREVERAFKRRKVRLLTGTRVQSIDAGPRRVHLATKSEQDGEQELEAERVLIATGVRPNTEGLGLQEAGIQLDRGHIVVDENMRTSAPGLYAIGDVTGKLPLAHVASAQGAVAAETIAGRESRALDYEGMPRCTYCEPQVASIGLTEAQALERGHEVKVGRFDFRANGKALSLGDHDGWVKIIADADSGEILGAHLVGPEVTELVAELVLARSSELVPSQVAQSVHAHPTLSEVVREAAEAVFGEAIHA
jgi:dihydrolipoamide dehydrogenase